ncbi:oxidoreductase [Punctularia strigosozonata HHB-11173 SS5]|uniref:oxidoreductase n=1 Tax=Punctularia strigosozonata (strain HHB-11173) TaxID=741275 RepID=UPI0004417242|nr:oxidoreductase [Punctularia strigosozonata HHB-11173 SS5]EIN09348.1 oxidoreductase [Punctularia strigosozonata HHB-11173 SS5]
MSSSPQKPFGGRVAIVGTGSRASMFVRGIVARPSTSSVVAICEPNPVRAAYYNELLASLGAPSVPIYKPESYVEMLEKEAVEAVVVTCVDALHDAYIVPALQKGLRVLTEKPMTTDVDKCRRILQTVNETGNHLTVTFNYRYNPVHELVKRTLASGKIGEVLSVHFEWLLDTVHGADYFRRWHRQKSNSGGLMVHKSGHHFDLVNWWLGASPVRVAGMGRLAFYGSGNAGQRAGWAKDYVRARGADEARGDPFAIDLEGDETLRRIYADAEGEDGYHRDQNVFAPGIGIEDDMSLLVRYDTGATMTYHLTAYSPWEGYRVMFNGSLGRLELEVVESQFRLPADPQIAGGQIHGTASLPNPGPATVRLHPLWRAPEVLPVEYEHGEHGGGDRRMLSVLFGALPGEEVDQGDAAKQGANERDGAMALAVGLMANESFRTGQFVDIESLRLPL